MIKIFIALKSTSTHIKNDSEILVVLIVIERYRALQPLRALIVGYSNSFIFYLEHIARAVEFA